MKKVLIGGHRGDRTNCPYNTMPSFKSAVNKGVDYIETDVRMTKDGELVLMHDRSGLRTTGVDRNIDEMLLSEVKALDAGELFSPDFKGTTIPTVKEFIEYIKDTDVCVNWELKLYPEDFPEEICFELADKLIAVIDEYNMAEKSIITCFSVKVLEHIYKKQGHRIPLQTEGLGYCRRSVDECNVPETELSDWSFLSPAEDTYTLENLEKWKSDFTLCKENNVHICVCFPKDIEAEYYRRVIEYGTEIIYTDNIEQTAQILKELGYR